MKIDSQALTNKLLAGVALAIILGAGSIYRATVRMEVELRVLTEKVEELRTVSHIHGSGSRVYLPDAPVIE